MKQFARIPSMWEARNIKLQAEIPDTAWPCTRCWGIGCDHCNDTGISDRSEFFGWYRKLYSRYMQARKLYQDVLDDDAKVIVGEDFYDLVRLRKIKSS